MRILLWMAMAFVISLVATGLSVLTGPAFRDILAVAGGIIVVLFVIALLTARQKEREAAEEKRARKERSEKLREEKLREIQQKKKGESN